MITSPESLGVCTRRSFLRLSAAASLAAPWLARPGFGAVSPNAKLQHASIGVGGMGAGDLDQFRSHPRTQVVALCDVDENALKAAAAKVPGARLYRDWRELLAQEGDRIDSVNVTVPDHMHFAIAWSAIQRGKHTYVQKPLCHDVAEVRVLTQAAAKQGVVTQLGTQLASMAGDRTTVQWLRDGVIGKVKHLYLSANRPGAVEHYRPLGPRPAQGEAPPATLAWDLWLGTAPERPFVPGIYHPVKWRGWLDFGTGWSGDIGCHIFDALWKGLELQAPKAAIARPQASWKESPARRADTWPQANHVTWTFPGNRFTEGAELPIEWFDGEFWAPQDIRALFSVEDYPTESAMVVGTEGALLHVPGGTPLLLPEARFKDVARPRFEPRHHYHHFVDTCLGTAKCECQFAQSGPMTEAILLGTVALRVPETRLEWDPAKLEIPNSADAHRLLRRTYRDGWRVTAV